MCVLLQGNMKLVYILVTHFPARTPALKLVEGRFGKEPPLLSADNKLLSTYTQLSQSPCSFRPPSRKGFDSVLLKMVSSSMGTLGTKPSVTEVTN